MKKKIPLHWGLGFEEVEEIYRVEVELSNKLRHASSGERKELYPLIYQQYFKRLPFHPQLIVKQNPALKQSRVDYQLRQILPFIKNKNRFVEIGAGDCSLSIAAGVYCREVFALEVSNEVTYDLSLPNNVKIILFDGFNIPLDDNSADVAYSNQLMEHLHPDDAEEQLKNVFRILKKDGVYICITPNRISGPHDVSRFFSEKPIGFHLREYSADDLRKVFLGSGFTRVIAYIIIKGRKIELPFLLVRIIEKIAESLPLCLREKFLQFRPVKIIFTSIIAAVK